MEYFKSLQIGYGFGNIQKCDSSKWNINSSVNYDDVFARSYFMSQIVKSCVYFSNGESSYE